MGIKRGDRLNGVKLSIFGQSHKEKDILKR